MYNTATTLTQQIGKNLDRSFDIWQIDMLALPRITVSPGATPTVVTWDSEAGPLRYVVVRGNVSNLAPGPSSTVSLGPVICL